MSPELFVVYVTINGEEIQGTITTYWNVELEMPNEVVLSQNLLNALQITQKEFDQKYSDVTASDPKIDLSPHTHTKCIHSCNEIFTDADGNKKKGRGACKANCWVDTVIRLIEAIVAG